MNSFDVSPITGITKTGLSSKFLLRISRNNEGTRTTDDDGHIVLLSGTEQIVSFATRASHRKTKTSHVKLQENHNPDAKAAKLVDKIVNCLDIQDENDNTILTIGICSCTLKNIGVKATNVEDVTVDKASLRAVVHIADLKRVVFYIQDANSLTMDDDDTAFCKFYIIVSAAQSSRDIVLQLSEQFGNRSVHRMSLEEVAEIPMKSRRRAAKRSSSDCLCRSSKNAVGDERSNSPPSKIRVLSVSTSPSRSYYSDSSSSSSLSGDDNYGSDIQLPLEPHYGSNVDDVAFAAFFQEVSSLHLSNDVQSIPEMHNFDPVMDLAFGVPSLVSAQSSSSFDGLETEPMQFPHQLLEDWPTLIEEQFRQQ